MLIQQDSPHHVRFARGADRATLGPDAGFFLGATLVISWLVATAVGLVWLPWSGWGIGWIVWAALCWLFVLWMSPRLLRAIAGGFLTSTRYRIEREEIVVEHRLPSRRPRFHRIARDRLRIEVGVCGVVVFRPQPWRLRWRRDRFIVWLRGEGGRVRTAVGVFRTEARARVYAARLSETLGAPWTVCAKRTTAVCLAAHAME